MGIHLGSTLRQWKDHASRLVQNSFALAATVYVTLRPDRAGSERAQHNAERIIAACREFETRHGRLPETLSELVPDVLPELPRAKFDDPHFGFTYDVTQQRHVLGWTDRLPFGRPYYVFEEDRWGYLD